MVQSNFGSFESQLPQCLSNWRHNFKQSIKADLTVKYSYVLGWLILGVIMSDWLITVKVAMEGFYNRRVLVFFNHDFTWVKTILLTESNDLGEMIRVTG